MTSIVVAKDILSRRIMLRSAGWMTRPRRGGLVSLLFAMLSLSGCGIWRETPTSQTTVIPADLHLDADTRTIDISYRLMGFDRLEHRQIKERHLDIIAEGFENSGYLLKATPWASQIGNHVKLRVEVGLDADVAMSVLCFLTAGALPEFGSDLTTIKVTAFRGQTVNIYEEQILVKTSRWCPLLCWVYPSHLGVARESRAGMEEVIRTIVLHLREDGILARPPQRAL